MHANSLDADSPSPNPANVYRPSGRLGSASIAVPLSALITIPILALVYAYVDVYFVPVLHHANSGFVAAVGFVGAYAFAIWAVVAKIGYKAKCRNVPFLRGMGFQAGLFGLYCSWVAFVYAFLNRVKAMPLGLWELFCQPETVWDRIEGINAVGWFPLWSHTPSGTALWILWGVEAAIIVGLPTFAAARAINWNIYCEDCNVWCSSWRTLLFKMPADGQRLTALRAGRLDPLEELQPAAEHERTHLRLRVHRCEACQMTAGYRVELVWCADIKIKGKYVPYVERPTPFILLTPTEFQKLEQFCARPMKGGGVEE